MKNGGLGAEPASMVTWGFLNGNPDRRFRVVFPRPARAQLLVWRLSGQNQYAGVGWHESSECALLSMSLIGLLYGLDSQQLPDLAHGVIHLHLENALAEFGA